MLTVIGPRADRFIELLERHSGLHLNFIGQLVQVDRTLPGNPFCSQTLQAVVQDLIGDVAQVEITARGDIGPGFIDAFDAPAALQVRSRTVFVRDLETLERLAPELAAAMMAHFLAEYFHAASRGTPRQFANAHVAGLIAEAQVIRDLTGRPIFEGNQRPWDSEIDRANGGVVLERRYGPGNVYRITLGPPPVNPVVAVSRP